MIEQTPLVPQPIQSQPTPTPTVPPAILISKLPNSQSKMYMIAAIIAISLGIIGIFTWNIVTQQTVSTTVPTPTSTNTPSPTPVRQLSAIASQSAFMVLDEKIASLSSSIKNYIIEDPSLSPPVLVLPLGFTQ